jgi:hypothetical protein
MTFDIKRYEARAKQRTASNIKVKKTDSWNTGYRKLGKRLADHPGGKAIQFEYFAWRLWIAASTVLVMPDGTYICPAAIINGAKHHPSAYKVEA